MQGTCTQLVDPHARVGHLADYPFQHFARGPQGRPIQGPGAWEEFAYESAVAQGRGTLLWQARLPAAVDVRQLQCIKGWFHADNGTSYWQTCCTSGIQLADGG